MESSIFKSLDTVSSALHALLQVSDELLAEVALGCPRLQRISISNCSSVTDKGVRGLAAGAPRLLAFVADDVGRLTDGCLLALGESCKSLQVSVPPVHSSAEWPPKAYMCQPAGPLDTLQN